MPIKKLGLNYCLNRQTSLLYVKNPCFKKEDIPSENYTQCLNEGEYLGMQPRFSKDYSKLCYIASNNKFLSHSGNYQMKYFEWPQTQSKLALDYCSQYPKDDEHFCGLYGYNMTYTPCRFLGNSNKFYLFSSEFKG